MLGLLGSGRAQAACRLSSRRPPVCVLPRSGASAFVINSTSSSSRRILRPHTSQGSGQLCATKSSSTSGDAKDSGKAGALAYNMGGVDTCRGGGRGSACMQSCSAAKCTHAQLRSVVDRMPCLRLMPGGLRAVHAVHARACKCTHFTEYITIFAPLPPDCSTRCQTHSV